MNIDLKILNKIFTKQIYITVKLASSLRNKIGFNICEVINELHHIKKT